MPERLSPLPNKLAGQQVGDVCRRLLLLGDEVPSLMESLQKAGFGAFVPYHEFVESFCNGQTDIELHRRCLVEGAKNRLGRPLAMVLSADYRDHLFFSPYVQQLLEKRDAANGVPESQLKSRYPGEIWRYEVDPCERCRIYNKVRNNVAYEEKWTAMLEAQSSQLSLEVARHATGLSKNHAFDRKGRRAFYRAVMERDTTSLGFHLDRSRSLSSFPVFTRKIANDWDFCWSVRDARMFCWNATEGRFDPSLLICHSGLSGNLAMAAAGEFMPIEYPHIVPGFGNAYWVFRSLDELETIIRAHAYLYGMMAPILEKAVREALG